MCEQWQRQRGPFRVIFLAFECGRQRCPGEAGQRVLGKPDILAQERRKRWDNGYGSL